jgi:FkbM family methyltransferase
MLRGTEPEEFLGLADDPEAVFPGNATELDIYECFRLLLGRFPLSKELQEHVSRAGKPLREVVTSFLNSPEFAKRGLMQHAGFGTELRTVQGFQMYVPVEDIAVGGEIASTGDYEPAVSHVFRTVVRPGMRVLDIGANIGFYSLLASSLVGTSGKVWAVEPNPRNVSLIHASRKANSFPNLFLVQGAASDRWEVLRLFTDASNGVTEAWVGEGVAVAGEPVQAFPVSAFLPPNEKIDVIKIDIEGSEGKVLAGMQELLRAYKPLVFSEFTPLAMPSRSGMSGADYLQFFYSLGYKLSVLWPKTEVQCGFEASRVMSELSESNHVDLLARPCLTT